MARVYVIVEGATEESFVSGPLAEFLWPSQVFLTPIILGVPGHKGGHTRYARVEKDILRQLKQDPGSYCTTMIDFYGLGRGFPGTPAPDHISKIQTVQHIERAVKDDICNKIPGFRPDIRLIPYLCLHEYESLLFSDPEAFARSLGRQDLAARFQQIRDGFPTPEDINNDSETAPSKRVLESCPTYSKVIQGTIAARAVGVQRMLEECPHFQAWLEQLQALPSL